MDVILYLCRHGETVWNREMRLQGQLDSDLTQSGQDQAQILGESLKDHNIQRILTSPLGRAKKTALICNQSLNCDVIEVDALKERNFGSHQGKVIECYSKIPSQSVQSESDCTIEPEEECATRFYNALTDYISKFTETPILVVSHGEIIRHFIQLIEPNQLALAVPENGNWLKVKFQGQRFSLC